LSSTLMPIAHLSRCDDMPIIMLIIPAGATHRPYRGGGGVTPSLGLLAAQYAAQARGEAGVTKHRAVFQIVRLPSKTPRECGHSGTAAQCQSRPNAPQQKNLYSITSSASASSLSGISRPSAFAVLRLMTRSSLVENAVIAVPACGAATNPSAGDVVKKGARWLALSVDRNADGHRLQCLARALVRVALFVIALRKRLALVDGDAARSPAAYRQRF